MGGEMIPSIHLHHQPRKNRGGTVNNYSLALSFREGGKNQKKIILGLGQLSTQQAAGYRILLKAMNQVGAGDLDKSYVISNIQTIELGCEKKYFDCLVLSCLWDQLKLASCFPKDAGGTQTLSTETTAKILTINRLLEPVSKARTVEWFAETMLDRILDINKSSYNKSKIFRELDCIHDCKTSLERHFSNFSLSQDAQGCRIFYFDGSTSWFEGTKCPLSKSGLEKTRGFYPQVLGIVMITDNLGYPIAWDVVTGNKKDSTELKTLVDRVAKDYGITEITYCFDRGVASEENFEYLNKSCGSKFISGLRDNQIEAFFDLDGFHKTRKRILKEIENSEESEKEPFKIRRVVDIDGFFRFSNKVYFKDLGLEQKNKVVRHILSFNYEIFKKEHKERSRGIEEALKAVTEMNMELLLAKQDRDFNATERALLDLLKKYGTRKYFSYSLLPKTSHYKKNSYHIELVFDRDAVQADEKRDGVLLFVTNHVEKEDTSNNFILCARDIITHFKMKFVIENSFREIKSFLEVRPFYVWTEKHVKAHFDIAVMGYFINNFIYRKLKKMEKPTVSLREFYRLLKAQANAIQISHPNGNSTLKIRKIEDLLQRSLTALLLGHISSPTEHTHLKEPI